MYRAMKCPQQAARARWRSDMAALRCRRSPGLPLRSVSRASAASVETQLRSLDLPWNHVQSAANTRAVRHRRLAHALLERPAKVVGAGEAGEPRHALETERRVESRAREKLPGMLHTQLDEVSLEGDAFFLSKGDGEI